MKTVFNFFDCLILFFVTHFSDAMQLALDFLDIADVSENAELVKLASTIPQVLQSSISMNTYKSYSAGFKKWATWCSKFDLKIFPVEQKLLLLFISELIHSKVSTAVLNSVIFSISWIHSISNVTDPCKSPVVQRMFEAETLGCRTD